MKRLRDEFTEPLENLFQKIESYNPNRLRDEKALVKRDATRKKK